tara:strand:- start:1581 stop:1820 length:240 start_codon:yes stop_codon:yes gene_type:complete
MSVVNNVSDIAADLISGTYTNVDFNKGGLVEEMEAMGFAKGGLPERTVPYGDSTNPSDQLGDVEFRADMDDWLRNNAVA